jgi:putative transposase
MESIPAWLTDWLAASTMPSEGKEAVAAAWRLEPARAVRPSPYNATVLVPSPKNGKLYEAESRTAERAWFWTWEYDDAVLGWVPQPAAPSIVLEYADASGRKIHHAHTCDALLVEADAAYLVDLKTEDDLVRGAERYPGRYTRVSGEGWRCPPLEAAAAPWGLKARLLSDAQVPRTLVRNLEFLRAYYR